MEKQIQFESFDGLALEGTLAIPQDMPLRGGALLIHGIETNRDEYGFYSSMAEYLSHNGIASFRFDHRAHEKYMNEMTMILSLSGLMNDFLQAMSIIKSQMETCNFYMIASSFSGGVAHFFTNQHQHIFKQCILLAPDLEYKTTYLQDKNLLSADGALREEAKKILTKNNYLGSAYRKMSRAMINEFGHFDAVAENNMIPTTIIHGSADRAVNITHSRQFAARARRVSLIELEGMDHGFAHPDDKDFNHPHTWKNHQKVYKLIIDTLE